MTSQNPTDPIPSFDPDFIDRIQDESDPMNWEGAMDHVLEGVQSHFKRQFKTPIIVPPAVNQTWGKYSPLKWKQLIALPVQKRFRPFKAPPLPEPETPQSSDPIHSKDVAPKASKSPTAPSTNPKPIQKQRPSSVEPPSPAGVILNTVPKTSQPTVQVSHHKELDIEPEPSPPMPAPPDPPSRPAASASAAQPPTGTPEQDNDDQPTIKSVDAKAISERYKNRQKSIQELLDQDRGSVT